MQVSARHSLGLSFVFQSLVCVLLVSMCASLDLCGCFRGLPVLGAQAIYCSLRKHDLKGCLPQNLC